MSTAREEVSALETGLLHYLMFGDAKLTIHTDVKLGAINEQRVWDQLLDECINKFGELCKVKYFDTPVMYRFHHKPCAQLTVLLQLFPRVQIMGTWWNEVHAVPLAKFDKRRLVCEATQSGNMIDGLIGLHLSWCELI